jgi:hypothetical protein
MRIVPFQPEHALAVRLQPMQATEGPPVTPVEAAALHAGGPAYTALGEDGAVLAAAGLLPQWPGRACAWAMIAHNAGPHFLRITREVRRVLEACDFRRIEITVDARFAAAVRWAEMLGFRRETPEPMAAYCPNGNPAYLYALVKD